MTLANAIARTDQTPAAVVASYRNAFAELLPPTVDPGAWVEGAVGRLRARPELTRAAAADISALMVALKDAARLGLTPATDEYWLTVRKGKIQGSVGYVGLIELMYRAGVVKAVHAEIVHRNDRFTYRPGVDERPSLEVDWTGDRGPIALAYAYAVMDGGATSRVVIVDPARIARAKAASDGSTSKYSPWVNDEAKMWLKTAVRDLAKWVPTSVMIRPADVADVADTDEQQPDLDPIDAGHIDLDTGEIVEVAE